jgi:predicted esterase
MRFLALLSFFTLAVVSATPAEPGLFGRVLDPVACEADPTQRYVLYVPTAYSPEKAWPVIFCFDSSARGRMPVERLQAAAERYGYIVAGSLNSRNGPWQANADAAQAMIRDVSAHFSVDSRRVYTAGVSGGARVATAIALSGAAQGVIACAAGFPELSDGLPLKVPFAFFGTTGTEDFNHAEMVRLEESLVTRATSHRLVIFRGGHAWAEADVMTAAVEWLELQAMRRNAQPRNEEFIRTQLAQRLEEVPATTGPDRWRAWRALAADFEGLVNVDEYRQMAAELAVAPAVQAGLKTERQLAKREEELINHLAESAQRSKSRRQKLLAEVRTLTSQAEDTREGQMGRRVVAGFVATANETTKDLLAAAEYDRAEGLLEMATELRPQLARSWFNLACARAWQNEKTGTITALERALDAGFKDGARIEAEPAFGRIRSDPAFQAVVARLTPAGPTPVPTGKDAAKILELPVLRISGVLAHVYIRPHYLPNARADLAGARDPVLSHLRIESVRPGTPAARAGLEAYMEITAIQGVRIRGQDDVSLNTLLARPAGPELRLTVRESPDARERELRIKLQ